VPLPHNKALTKLNYLSQ